MLERHCAAEGDDGGVPSSGRATREGDMGNTDRRTSHKPRGLRERGQSLVEFSIILPLILVMLIGVIEVTTVFTHYVSVVNASRDGARFGSKGYTDADIRAVAAIDLSKLPNSVQITPTAAISIDRTPPASLSGDNTVTVKVCYDHHTLLQIGLILPDIVPICDSTTMRVVPTPGP
jgi:Flp pilus assembly protein TadG